MRWILLMFIAAAGCGNKAGGEDLWRDACKHSMTLEDPSWRASNKAEEHIVGNCVHAMSTIPQDEADDMARCVLSKKSVNDIEACTPPSLRRRFEEEKQQKAARDVMYKQAMAVGRKVSAAYQQAIAYQREHGSYPQLAGDVGLVEPDPWGGDYLVQVLEHGPKICSMGPDRQAYTEDDICAPKAAPTQ